MIDRLVHGLAEGADLTREEILDVLWLAATYPARQFMPARDESGTEQPVHETGKSAPEDSEPISAPQEPMPLHMDGEPTGSEQRVSATEIGFDAPRPIRDVLTLPVALRRLRRVRAPGPRLTVDIEATIDATAEAGRLYPVLSRPQQRALDLAIVVDDSWSLRIWDDTLDDLERLLAQTGAFRAVARWRLSPQSGGIRPDTLSGARNASYPPERLVDPSGRRLVIVATDARDAYWYTAPPWKALAAWGAAMPTVLVQVLPPHYWAETAIGDPYIIARARRPAAPNKQYEHRLAWWANGDDPGGLPLPVMTLDPSAADSWAQAVVNGTAWSTGITATPPDPDYIPVTPDDLAADALVNGFFSRASPGAQRLARILASAATLSMPLITVLRDRLAPETGIAELAEILASGLLIKTRSAIAAGQPLLRYRPGTKEILQRGTTALEEWDAYAAVSRYLQDRQRLGGQLRALVGDPTGSAMLDADDEPFAELEHALVTRLGLRTVSADTLAPPLDPMEQNAALTEVPDVSPRLRAVDGRARDWEGGRVLGSGADRMDHELDEILLTTVGALAESAVSRPYSDDEVQDVLTDELGRLLGGNTTFTVAELAVDSATIIEVSRDLHGTPKAFRWTYAYEDGVLRPGEPDQWSEAMADPERFYRRVAPVCVVCTRHSLPGALNDLLAGAGGVPVYSCVKSLQDLLRTAVAESPLTLGYELAVLRRVPRGRVGAGQFVLTGQPLFWPGETRGSEVSVRVNVEPTDDDGTVFAVVTREPRPDRPRLARELRPLQIQAAAFPPGTYELTAILSRPGLVQFGGLPVSLGDSSRSWDELKLLVPSRLTAPLPTHLICLIEICGGIDRLRQRIDRLEQLIITAQDDASVPLRVSVIAYGAHGVAWRVEDRAPEVRAWAMSGDEAIGALHRLLANRLVDEREYLRAAQLECALKLVREHLSVGDLRPVIVTAGGRPSHPPGLDTKQKIIPCPEWVDGVSELERLATVPGITFGAIRDPRCRGGLWDQLGQHATATVDDVADMESFAVDLGLRLGTLIVPFPVIE